MMKELNRKLAEWAGFTSEEVKARAADFTGIYIGGDGLPKKPPETYMKTLWHYPEESGETEKGVEITASKFARVPDFTSSLDACFKWLVPKMFYYQLSGDGKKHHCEILHKVIQGYYGGDAETPSLALCLAIEKLIDAEE